MDKQMNIKPPLYHGTDARIIEMSDKERQQYIENCNICIDYLWEQYKPYLVQEQCQTTINGQLAYIQKNKLEQFKDLLTKRGNPYMYINLLTAVNRTECYKSESGLYQYGYLYLTGDKEKAKRYAIDSFAGGELGLNAYRLLEGAFVLGLDMKPKDKDIEYAIKRIKSFAEDVEHHNPILIEVHNIEPEYLLSENGEPINYTLNLSHNILSYRYTKKYKLDLYNAIFLKQRKWM